MSKMPPSTTLDDNDDISDDESVDLLAPTQDGFALNSRDAPMSPDCLAVTEDINPTTPITTIDMNSSIHPLSARVRSLGRRVSDSGLFDNQPSQNNVWFCLDGIDMPSQNSVRFSLGGIDMGNDDGTSSEGTVVPGTQLPTPYGYITAASRREVVGRSANILLEVNLDIPPDCEMIIRQAILDDWGIACPHDFQVTTIYDLAFFRDRLVFVIAKTGSGKSAIPLTVGSLQRGITLTMVPLIRLGSNQVDKSTNEEAMMLVCSWSVSYQLPTQLTSPSFCMPPPRHYKPERFGTSACSTCPRVI